ncbi:MAG TPA: winged helix-turn-helix domain-containing protein [Dongiaceae bacterium]|nr:winged helix-turn-helix domain-containing protein [Dongiaceae bacterium]
MPRATSKTKKSAVPDAARLRIQLRLMLAEEIALGPGKVDLLQTIHNTGSISAAGRAMNMSYRRAWLLVDAMNRCFTAPLVDTAKGGSQGGGARLTPLGEQVLQIYQLMRSDVQAVADPHFQQLAALLRHEPLPVG